MIGSNIIGWIAGIFMVLSVGGVLIINAIRLINTIKCRNKFRDIKDMCENTKCKTRFMCRKYDNTKEILALRIEVLKKQIEMEEDVLEKEQ